MKNFLFKLVLRLSLNSYKTPIRRKIHKAFFKFLQIILFKIKFHIKDIKVDKNYIKFLNQGFVIIDKKINFNLKIKSKLINSIRLAKSIFENEKLQYVKNNKPYLKNINFHSTVNAGKTFYELFTDDYFLNFAKNYFNDIPLLTEIKLLHSPITHDNLFTGSQLLHSDHDDNKLMKIFIYLNDVTQESGQLEIVNKYISKRIMKNSYYRWGQENRKYKSHDDLLLNLYPNNNAINLLIGNKGTIVIADTANCLHRGSRNPNKERLVLYATYSSRTSFSHPPINWIFQTKTASLISSPLMSLDPIGIYINEIAINN